jgi:uncharacterized membrane protein YhhN
MIQNTIDADYQQRKIFLGGEMTRLILTILAIISASLHIWGEYQGPDYLIYIFKPLTMIFIIIIAVLAKEPPSRRYKIVIIAGLIFSIIGDVLLSLPVDAFMIGLISFLIAQLIYTYAFRAGRPFRFKFIAILPFVIYGVIIFIILLPGLNGMVVPVVVYLIVMISDSILALNKFGEPFLAARALTLTTYFSAQWLISNSNYT